MIRWETIEKLQQAKDKLQNDYQNAVDKINELQQKIDKAIEFLHNNTMIGHCKEHYELLEILGDKE